MNKDIAINKNERVDLPITGMTCAACARRIEREPSKTAKRFVGFGQLCDAASDC